MQRRKGSPVAWKGRDSIITAMPLGKFDASIDYYDRLGISVNATQSEIDRAFRRNARKHHPDRGGSDEIMKSLNEAHDVLSDPETRLAYDLERRPKRTSVPASAVFDPDAASRAGTLKIPVSDPDFAGALIGTAACFVVGIPLLLLVETQWVSFLWPLRIMSLCAILIGVYMAHSALSIRRRNQRIIQPVRSRSYDLLQEAAFWVIAAGLFAALIGFLYF